MAEACRASDLPADAQALLRTIVRGCLREQGLPAGRRHVNAAIELIDHGFARVCQHGDGYWLEAL
ncbi:MAG: hypothetical protein ABTQ27_10685 [Amaricoccus sp.]|uniref:hypothetical protein n=1 Tax=Amaricoccus sp. TaxID=1872485 RepID=UPI003315AB04